MFLSRYAGGTRVAMRTGSSTVGAGPVNGGIGKQTDRAQKMMGSLYNSYAGTGSLLVDDVSQILHHENVTDIAVLNGWIYGKQDNEPWQFFSGPMPANISLNFGQGDYAILAVNASVYYVFMFTGYQNDHR
jgi:hypothetical protein